MKLRHLAGVIITIVAFALASTYPAAGQPGSSKRLLNAKSEFLRRAAEQPVDWYPLGTEALTRARQTKKPILVDVGASWCPFCRSMDRDGYSNSEIAGFINQHFVAVRIDYDAQPELAHSLELAQALANLPSGLPLTMFVTPNGKLYEGGGYFSSTQTKDRPSFAEFLKQAAGEYEGNRFHVEPWDINSELKVTR